MTLPLQQSGGGGTASLPTWDQIGSAAANLSLSNAGFTTTFNQTSAVPWLWANTTIASAVTANASALLEVAANYWTGAASAQDLWTLGSTLAAGTNGKSVLAFTHTGSSGSAYVQIPSLLQFNNSGACGIDSGSANGGSLTFSQQSGIGSAGKISWGASLGWAFATTAQGVPLQFVGNFVGQTGASVVTVGNASSFSPTSGAVIGVEIGKVTGTAGPSSAGFTFNGSSTSTFTAVQIDPTDARSTAGSTGRFTGLAITPTINITNTLAAGYTALLVNPTETSVGTGTKNLLDLQVGSSSKFTVNNTGAVTAVGGVAATGQGVPSEVGVITAATASAAVTATTLLAAPVAATLYRVSAYMKVTVATASPVAGPITLTYKDSDGVAQSVVMQLQNAAGASTTTTGSTTTTPAMGSTRVYAGSGTALAYAIAFAGTGSYEYTFKCEAL